MPAIAQLVDDPDVRVAPGPATTETKRDSHCHILPGLRRRRNGNPEDVIGKLRSVVLDTSDTRRLAAFYAALLGGEVEAEDDTWVVLTEPAGRRLAFQLAPEHAPPQFPDPAGSQQFHLDVHVDDVDDAESKVLALGATRVTDAIGEDHFRVYRDPSGHPFCLVWDVEG
jgi:catechol 2,3-dioxygenase-like lactoylglutathione lyase family enzyme